MSGMGYPSTWKNVLDEKGERIPKRNKNGEIILNKDGSVRYRQEPDKQGIIDWIEDQKCWLQQEMKKRYDWDREYKGSHPRGNLSTPEYRAVRAKERLQESEELIRQSLYIYRNRVDELTDQLNSAVEQNWNSSTNQELIERYLRMCTDEEYNALVEKAADFLDQLAVREKQRTYSNLNNLIRLAEEKRSVPTEKNELGKKER